MCWTHQIALCYQSCHRGFTAKITGFPNIVCILGQPCHGGFTVKITDSPNMVCMINHAMEDCSIEYYILLQILLISLPCENRKNKERLRWLREQYRVRRGE